MNLNPGPDSPKSKICILSPGANRRVVHFKVMKSCNVCPYKTTDTGLLKLHIESEHIGLTYKCQDCVFETASKSHLSTHTKNVHLNIRFSCEICTFKTATKQYLKVHIQRHNKTLSN